MSDCAHENFAANVAVNRITDTEGGPVGGFLADITVSCADCDEPFCWRGLPMGLSHLAPTASLDATVMTAPLHPMSDPTTGIGMPGFNVKVTP